MCREGLAAAGKGGGYSRDEKVNLIGITFDANQVMDMTVARDLIVKSITVLLDIINSNPKNKEYFEVFPVTAHITDNKIIGGVPQTPPVPDGYIWSVSAKEGKISYYTRDPYERFGPRFDVHEETFEEAQRIVNQQKRLEKE